MPLHPQAQDFLDLLSSADTQPIGEMDLQAMRNMAAMPFKIEQQVPVATVTDLKVTADNIPLRIYSPAGEGPFPLLMFCHGGGFVSCGLDTHDDLCRVLCQRIGAVVVSVDYRLAPEHRFPVAPEDCYAATCWAAGHADQLNIDSRQMAIAGDSAGGNLAAVVCMMARDRNGPQLLHQVLIYPVTNYGFDLPSYQQNKEGYFLSTEGMKWCWNLYLADEQQGNDPMASPLKATDLGKLPAATVITAEYDPLRDEGEAYADRLQAAGSEVVKRRYQGMIHGFVSMRTIMSESAEQALELIVDRLKHAYQNS